MPLQGARIYALCIYFSYSLKKRNLIQSSRVFLSPVALITPLQSKGILSRRADVPCRLPIIAAGAGERFQFQSAQRRAQQKGSLRTRAILIRPPGKTLEREEDEWPAAAEFSRFCTHSLSAKKLQLVGRRAGGRAGEPIFFSPENIDVCICTPAMPFNRLCEREREWVPCWLCCRLEQERDVHQAKIAFLSPAFGSPF